MLLSLNCACGGGGIGYGGGLGYAAGKGGLGLGLGYGGGYGGGIAPGLGLGYGAGLGLGLPYSRCSRLWFGRHRRSRIGQRRWTRLPRSTSLRWIWFRTRTRNSTWFNWLRRFVEIIYIIIVYLYFI
ncbi:hypothetical protein CEXT_400211 [Caerostris extrusa]|uniref:Uncharacterized protein n=1 Tax=Caerostris extrusa TaxID=172846 RepID=A0AAV4VY08_CAEEX|nr:hypothetical protein CEXT_400211 [Caerostris extrusa]